MWVVVGDRVPLPCFSVWCNKTCLEINGFSSKLHEWLYAQHHGSCYLEYVSLEDVVSQFHSLLPVQLALLSGEHKGQESVATPADILYLFDNN